MKTQESFAYVVGVDVSKAKLDIALPKESLTIKNNAKAIQAFRANGTTSSGFGWLNPVQLGGVGGPPIISPRNGTMVARITF